MNFTLTDGQEKVLEKGLKWYKARNKDRPIFEVDGAAGTGKTSVIFSLIKELGIDFKDVLFMAYVGKATLAMSRKGLNAKTIHSTIYEPKLVEKRDESGKIMINDVGRPVQTLKFTKRESLPPNIKLIVIDESGMVPENMGKDLLSFNIPIIALGDLSQLPPVMGKSFFLKSPDVTLTEIVRQNAENPILYLATQARLGNKIKIGKYGDKCFVIPKEKITENMLIEHDITICGTNKKRDEINHYYRNTILGYKDDTSIKVNDKIICRRNNWDRSIGEISLINGLIGYVYEICNDLSSNYSIGLSFRPEFIQDDWFRDLVIDKDYLETPVSVKANSDVSYKFSKFDLFEYAYAITCHLSQGSEYDKVFVYDDINRFHSKYHQQWQYTAITRAKEQLILAI